MSAIVKAVVQKVIPDGKHGPFAVATSEELEGSGSITFSLEPTVWKEKELPQEGMMVCLGDLVKKRAGWRAESGRFFRPSDEQTANSKEQDMLKRIIVLIEGLRNKWFPTADDKVWKQWVDYKQRETRDLVGLLTSDVRDSLKRRALFLLLVPSADANPIYWKEKVGKFYHGVDFLKTLTSDLLVYAVDLIVEFCTMLKPLHCDKPTQYSQGGGGITVLMSIPDKYHDALQFYNYCILLLLTLLPEEQCERIFPLFSLRDISTFCGMEDSSGYAPFEYLLRSSASEQWKRRADAAMRQIVSDELAGNTQPRERWEGALRHYADTIAHQLWGEGLSYGIDLYADQIRFLFSEVHYGHRLINGWDVGKLLWILSGSAYKEIRYQVVKFVILGNKEEFKVWSGETLQSAEMMLTELGQDDIELAQKIQSSIDIGKEQSAEQQRQRESVQRTEDEIMSQMK